jgi:uncharacterized protein
MEMTGDQLIPLAQADVWRGLNDPEILKACIAGCESIDKTAENEYKIAMVAAVGPVKARFTGKLALSDINPPNSYSIAFEGSGGAAGFAKGGADVKLATEGSSTRLTYTAKANIGGKLAQIGSRLVDGVAQKMADDFFVKFSNVMGSSASSNAAAPAAAAHEGAEAEPFNPIWIVGGTILAMLVVWAMMGGAR